MVTWKHLAPEQVREILLSRESNSALARRFGRSRWAISLIRLGRSHADLWPEIPRRGAPRSCNDCRHWSRGHCSWGFPDPELEGPAFAALCESFEVMND